MGRACCSRQRPGGSTSARAVVSHVVTGVDTRMPGAFLRACCVVDAIATVPDIDGQPRRRRAAGAAWLAAAARATPILGESHDAAGRWPLADL